MSDPKLNLRYRDLSLKVLKPILQHIHRILVFPRISEHFEIQDYEKFRPYLKISKCLTIDEIRKLLSSTEFKKQLMHFKTYAESLYSEDEKKGPIIDVTILDKLSYYLKVNFNYVQAIEKYRTYRPTFSDECNICNMAFIGSKLKTTSGYINEVETIIPFFSSSKSNKTVEDNTLLLQQAYEIELTRLKEEAGQIDRFQQSIVDEKINYSNELIKLELDPAEKLDFTNKLPECYIFAKIEDSIIVSKVECDNSYNIELQEADLNLSVRNERKVISKDLKMGSQIIGSDMAQHKFSESMILERYEDYDHNPSTSDELQNSENFESKNELNSRFANLKDEYDSTIKVDDNYLNQLGFQEFSRYFEPSKPFIYQIEDPKGVCFKFYVQPLQSASKLNSVPIMKTFRNSNIYLVKERITSVSFESIIRDSCARLPDGVGTVMDITILTIQSIFVKKDIPITTFLKTIKETLLKFEKLDLCIYRDKINPFIWHYDTKYIKEKYFKSYLAVGASPSESNAKTKEVSRKNVNESKDQTKKLSSLLKVKRKSNAFTK